MMDDTLQQRQLNILLAMYRHYYPAGTAPEETDAFLADLIAGGTISKESALILKRMICSSTPQDNNAPGN